VATIDVPGVFMQADMKDTVHMKLEGTMADLLINLAPEMYKKFAYKYNGKTVLYVKKGTIWHSQSCSAVLEVAIISTAGVGF
jgi:hypothetical protein